MVPSVSRTATRASAISRREMLCGAASTVALLLGAGRSGIANSDEDFVIVNGWVLSARDLVSAPVKDDR